MAQDNELYVRLGSIETNIEYIKTGIDVLKNCIKGSEERISLIEEKINYFSGASAVVLSIIGYIGYTVMEWSH